MHVQLPVEILNGQFCRIQISVVHFDAQSHEVDRVDNLAEIVGIAVFPPSNARFIREPYTADVSAPV